MPPSVDRGTLFCVTTSITTSLRPLCVTTGRQRGAALTALLIYHEANSMHFDIYLTAIGCIPGDSGTRLQPKLHTTTTINTNNTSSKQFTLLWAEVRVRILPRLLVQDIAVNIRFFY